jgi:hypothetical protein
MALASSGHFFYRTLNLRLIWSLVLVICVAIIVKSLPYLLNSATSSTIYRFDQLAGAFFLGVILTIFFYFFILSSRAISSMKV